MLLLSHNVNGTSLHGPPQRRDNQYLKPSWDSIFTSLPQSATLLLATHVLPCLLRMLKLSLPLPYLFFSQCRCGQAVKNLSGGTLTPSRPASLTPYFFSIALWLQYRRSVCTLRHFHLFSSTSAATTTPCRLIGLGWLRGSAASPNTLKFSLFTYLRVVDPAHRVLQVTTADIYITCVRVCSCVCMSRSEDT